MTFVVTALHPVKLNTHWLVLFLFLIDKEKVKKKSNTSEVKNKIVHFLCKLVLCLTRMALNYRRHIDVDHCSSRKNANQSPSRENMASL